MSGRLKESRAFVTLVDLFGLLRGSSGRPCKPHSTDSEQKVSFLCEISPWSWSVHLEDVNRAVFVQLPWWFTGCSHR